MSSRSTAAPAGARLFSVVTWDNVAQRRYGCVPTCFGLPSVQRRGGAHRAGHARSVVARIPHQHERSERPSMANTAVADPDTGLTQRATRRSVRPDGRRRATLPGRVHPAAVGLPALHRGVREARLRRLVQQGPAGPAVAGADPADQRGGLLPDLRRDAGHRTRHRQLHRVPVHRRLHLHLHPVLGARRHPGDQRQPRADPGAALPPGQPADRRHADRSSSSC